MKTIKTLLTIVIMIASTTFAKAQEKNPKYHYHDNAFQLAKASSFVAKANNLAIQLPIATIQEINPKYHYHDNAFQLTTATIKVYGECGFCKKHIEDAAKIKGVSSAKWDENTQLLTVLYYNRFTNLDKIQQSEAVVGHDTEKYTASDVAYNNLPLCCHYRKG